MALGQAARISLSQHNLAPQNTQENAQLTARGCLGRAKPWEHREKLVPEEPSSAPAPSASSSLHLPTSFPGHQLAAPSQAGSTFPGWQHHPRPALPGQSEGAFRKPRRSARSVSFLFTTILYYYLFIRSYFYFALNMPSCVILVLLKM